jgi:hypothetical protein
VGAEIDEHGGSLFDTSNGAETVLVVGDPVIYRETLRGRLGIGNIERTGCQVAPGHGVVRAHCCQYAPACAAAVTRTSGSWRRTSALSGTRAAHTESRGGVPGVSPAFAPALVFDGESDMPHADFEREGVILVHSAQLLHERHHVRHRAAGQALHTDELSASGLGEAGNRARFNPVKSPMLILQLAADGPLFAE